jgi:hypothetical protein
MLLLLGNQSRCTTRIQCNARLLKQLMRGRLTGASTAVLFYIHTPHGSRKPSCYTAAGMHNVRLQQSQCQVTAVTKCRLEALSPCAARCMLLVSASPTRLFCDQHTSTSTQHLARQQEGTAVKIGPAFTNSKGCKTWLLHTQ